LITASVKKGFSGQILGYEGIMKDISGRKRMEEELFQRTKELGALYELSVLVNQTLNLDRVLPLALERVLALTGFEMGTIYLISDDREWLELKYHQNYPDHLAEAVKKLKRGEGVVGSAVEKKEVVFFPIGQYPSPHFLSNLIKEKVKTLVGIPLFSKGEAIGAICLTTRSERLLGENDIHLFESFGNQIGMALENAKLFSSVAKGKSEWETTFNAVTDLITIRDRDYHIIRANKAAFRRYGLEPEKIVGKSCYELFHQRAVPCDGCYVNEAIKTGKPVSGQRESAYLNGVFQYYTYPVYDSSEKVVAIVDLAREITEEKRLEKENEAINNINKILAANLDIRQVTKAIHAELKKVLSSDRMTITLLDEAANRFRYFALEKDYEREELTKDRSYPIEGALFSQVVRTGQPALAEDLFENEVWLDQRLIQEGIRSYLVFPLEYQGKIIGTLNFGSEKPRNFSERHFNALRQIAPGMAISIQNALLLDEIRGSEEKYRTVVEGAHDGICVIGKENQFKFVNKRLTEIQGYPQEELIGKDFGEFVDEESRRLMTDRFTRRERGEELPPSFELKAVRKDGEIRNIEINAKVIKDSQGEINYIVFMKDITEKKKMEEQLLQTEKLRALGEMASGVAHDFNNALAAILGNTQLLLYSVQDEEMRESLKTIEKVAKDSAQTVKRLQEFTKKRARQELFKLDINSIIRDVIEITKPKWKDEAQGKGNPIEMALQLGDLPKVAGNASEMREVITNIIFNAIEAMSGGGKIEIRTYQRGNNVHIRIADTGAGMDEETRKRIFEPFFTTKPFSNTGLGLSMSYGIIKRFGGEIEVESNVGVGTTFTIVLPVSLSGKEETKVDTTIKIGKSLRVLVIDDEETVRSVLEKLLSQANHQVTVTNDGEKGIQLFQQKEFDIVLTDLGMPGLSGWEVCQRIKKIKQATPVGMITGWGMELSQDKMKEYGLDFILSKPFDFSQVIKVVSETIGLRT
jgi:PAS domain S-box-containing protein